MEIHRPKPWHGWREFLKEYLVIFVGVLTALAFGQGAEWLHQRAEVSEARHALKLEVAINASAAIQIIEQERCINALTKQYLAWAQGRARALPPQAPPSATGGFSGPRMTTWETVRAGPVTHMPLKEREAYARFYRRVESTRINLETESPFRLRVVAQVNRARAMGVIDAERLFEDAEQAISLGTIRSMSATDILNQAKEMGVGPEPITAVRRKQLAALCNAAGIAPAFE